MSTQHPRVSRGELVLLLNRFAGTAESADTAKTARAFIKAATANQELYDPTRADVGEAFALGLITEGEATHGEMTEPVVRLTDWGREHLQLVALAYPTRRAA